MDRSVVTVLFGEGLRGSLLRSHLTIAALGFAILAVTLIAILSLRQATERLAHVEAPAAVSSAEALSGVYASLAALRGWIVIGDERFRAARLDAWETRIQPALKELASLGAEDVEVIEHTLLRLKESQWWVEELAHTPGNRPAVELYELNIQPIATEIDRSMAALIKSYEGRVGSRAVVAALQTMTEARIRFTLSNLRLSDLIHSSDGSSTERFFTEVRALATDLAALSSSSASMAGDAEAILGLVRRELTAYVHFSDQVVKLVDENGEGRAQTMLAEETVPLAAAAVSLLEALSESKAEAVLERAAGVERVAVGTSVLVAILIGVMLVLAVALSRRNAERITEPVLSLWHAVTAVAAGRDTKDVSITQPRELADLAKAFNIMRVSLAAGQNALLEANLRLEARVAQRTAELNEARLRAEITLASIGDAVITTDAAGRVLTQNPAAESMLGWDFDDTRGRVLGEFLRTADGESEGPATLVQAAVETRRAKKVPVARLTRKDGESLYVSACAAPVANTMGGVAGAVLVLRDVSAEQLSREQLQYRASHDPLTGLVNRTEFRARMDRVFEQRQNGERRRSVVLCMDLDQFKQVNDNAGHEAGDELLINTTRLMQARLRSRDTLARLGGDEFAALLEHCDVRRGVAVAEKVRQAIEALEFQWEAKTFRIGVSIGIAELDPRLPDVEAVMRAADTACYAAKSKGRNRIEVYRPPEQSDTRVGSVASIRRA